MAGQQVRLVSDQIGVGSPSDGGQSILVVEGSRVRDKVWEFGLGLDNVERRLQWQGWCQKWRRWLGFGLGPGGIELQTEKEEEDEGL
ncbi:hypothetical protein Acr_05g0005650 [Actinidia rufa]|uniref:Uncharacterized protein n=1 Tax=Actinidia rufa TaxID=165716 RepID=A0A7J0EL32_9ERIC|nr:hypothetical protein Acr_05g0005650 [Actinidia rufa]